MLTAIFVVKTGGHTDFRRSAPSGTRKLYGSSGMELGNYMEITRKCSVEHGSVEVQHELGNLMEI